MIRKRDVREARQSKERERQRGFSSVDVLQIFAEATTLPSWAPPEWIPAARVYVPYETRKLIWPSCSPQAQREYYRRNWARIRANQRRYYLKNRVAKNAQSIAWQRKNRDKVNARRRELRAMNPEPHRARHRVWRQANRDKLNASRRRRRALLRGSSTRSRRQAAA